MIQIRRRSKKAWASFKRFPSTPQAIQSTVFKTLQKLRQPEYKRITPSPPYSAPQSARLSLQSSELAPHPHSQASVSPLWLPGGGHFCRKGVGPIRTRGHRINEINQRRLLYFILYCIFSFGFVFRKAADLGPVALQLSQHLTKGALQRMAAASVSWRDGNLRCFFAKFAITSKMNGGVWFSCRNNL